MEPKTKLIKGKTYTYLTTVNSKHDTLSVETDAHKNGYYTWHHQPSKKSNATEIWIRKK